MKLAENVVKSFKVAKVFRNNCERVTSMDFNSNGDYIVVSNKNDEIAMYDCYNGIHTLTTNISVYGVDLIRFTHAKNAVIHASTKGNDALRYLSLYDNKYIRFLPGHVNRVLTLCTSPIDDTILSGSADKTLRIWDLRSPNCAGVMRTSCIRPVGAFDPEGLVFAAGLNSEFIKLYDLRSYSNGPFSSFHLPKERECDWTGLKFSPDGKKILLSTNGSVIRLLDAFTGAPFQSLSGYANRGLPIEASFSPDSQFVFSGSVDGNIHAWLVETGRKVHILSGGHPASVQCVRFSPRRALLTTACLNVAFWLPSISMGDSFSF